MTQPSQRNDERNLLTITRDPDGCRRYAELPGDEAVEIATVRIAMLANYGQGCKAMHEKDNAPCAAVCQCKAEAEAIIGDLFHSAS